jgi:uncharacterized ferritin-like protein (DUF455 family)
MVHEARGLDVNKSTIQKFRNAGDAESASTLEIIHNDEIGHVARGQRWFRYLCEVDGLDCYEVFGKVVRTHFRGDLKPPFNEDDRVKAGIDSRYYLPLSGGGSVKNVDA